MSVRDSIADTNLLGHADEMTDAPRPERLRLVDWFKPTLGAIFFGALMYVSMALGARGKPVFGVAFIFVGLAAVVAGKMLTKPYSNWAFGFYIFASGCLVFGAALLAARA